MNNNIIPEREATTFGWNLYDQNNTISMHRALKPNICQFEHRNCVGREKCNEWMQNALKKAWRREICKLRDTGILIEKSLVFLWILELCWGHLKTFFLLPWPIIVPVILQAMYKLRKIENLKHKPNGPKSSGQQTAAVSQTILFLTFWHHVQPHLNQLWNLSTFNAHNRPLTSDSCRKKYWRFEKLKSKQKRVQRVALSTTEKFLSVQEFRAVKSATFMMKTFIIEQHFMAVESSPRSFHNRSSCDACVFRI